MDFSKDEIVKANNFLRKRSLICANSGTPVDRNIIELLSDKMNSDEFNSTIMTKLDYENKHKLIQSLSQARYNKYNPTKQIKFKKEVADKFAEFRGSKSNNDFILELLEMYEKNQNKKG